MKAAFLDRDGVINRDLGYVYKCEDFEFLPGAIEGMRLLSEAGFRIIIVTNQSGIARGLYDEAAFHAITAWMRDKLIKHGVPILDVYHCPHHPQGAVSAHARLCDCRKPAPGLLLRAQADHKIDMSNSIMIGDKSSDMAAARAAAVGRAFLLLPGARTEGIAALAGADTVLPDLKACADNILGSVT